MNKLNILVVMCAGAVFITSSVTTAAPVAYIDHASFIADLPGNSINLDFDNFTAPVTVNSGDTIGSITFTYNFNGLNMVITDGAQFNGGGPFDTISGSNFLGTEDADMFLDDDDFSMSFNAVNAIGMYFVTAEEPGVSIFDGDIQLTFGNTTALLDVGAVQTTLGDGSLVFFLGLIDTSNAFTTASISTPNSSGAFLYNIDDITTAVVPVPAAVWLFCSGLLGLVAFSRTS